MDSLIPDVEDEEKTKSLIPDDEDDSDDEIPVRSAKSVTRKRVSDATLKRIQEYANAPSRSKAAPKAEPKAQQLGLFGTIKEGAKSTARALGATIDTYQGDEGDVVSAAKAQNEAPKDPRLAGFLSAIEDQKKKLGPDPSLWESIKAVGGAAIDNPAGAGLLIAEQGANSLAALGSAGAGALAGGAVAGPVGAVVGGLGGLAFANVGLETGHKALEAASGGTFTPEEQSRVKGEGAVKGGVITGVDTLTLGATKFITGASRRAVESATKKVLTDQGVDVANAAAVKTALADPAIMATVNEARKAASDASTTLGRRIARTGGALALETIGEGVGEFVGEFAATGKADVVDAVLESITSLSQSMGEVAFTSALNKRAENRLFNSEDAAAKAAETDTENTGVPHEVKPHPVEPEKFVAVPKPAAGDGVEIEQNELGEVLPKAPEAQATADPKLEKKRKKNVEAFAKNPSIIPGVDDIAPAPGTPTISGKPVTELSNGTLKYSAERGSAATKQAAKAEIVRRKKEGVDPKIGDAKATPSETLDTIIKTGAEKAQETTKGPDVPKPTPTPVKPPKAVKTAKPVKPEEVKVAEPVAPPKAEPVNPVADTPDTPAKPAEVSPKPAPAAVVTPDTSDTPKNTKPQPRPEIRPLIDALIKRHAVAHGELHRGNTFNKVMKAAKAFMAGEEVLPKSFKKAAEILKGDPVAVDLLNQLHAKAIESKKAAKATPVPAPAVTHEPVKPEVKAEAKTAAAPEAAVKTETAEPKPVQKKQPAKKRDLPALLKEHFAPGNIVLSSYSREHDRVLSFDWNNGAWSTTVERVKKDKDGNWVATEKPRTHSTEPDAKSTVVHRQPQDTPAPAKPEPKAAPAKAAKKPKAEKPAAPETTDTLPGDDEELPGDGEVEETEGASDSELNQIAREFKLRQSSLEDGDHEITNVFAKPKKKEIVRLADKVKVYHAQHGWMTVGEAKKQIAKWKSHAQAQFNDPAIRTANSQKIVLSLFDYTGAWSRPWEEAGYQVYRFDIQNDPNMGDVNNFSNEFFSDWFGDFEGQDIYAILAACPCDHFANSGSKYWAAKDKDGRTVSGVKLVHQTLATIEHFKPAIWSVENPAGRIQRLGGLPPWRLSFNPNHLGDPYTKRTLIWGRFNGDLPIAPVAPSKGSMMHTQYGGKSLKTKNARSVTPDGFSYGFFMANNAHDHQAMGVANKYDRLDRGLIEKAMAAGVTEDDIDNAVEDFYYMDLDDDAANEAIKELIPSGKASFSRGKSSGPALARSNVESVAKAISAKWKNAPDIVVLDSMDDAPDIAKSENGRQLMQGATGEPEGFIADGKVYLIASQMKSPEDVVRVLLHESLGHAGLQGVFGQDLHKILKQISALRRGDVTAKAKQYGLDMEIESDRLTAAEEVLAEMAQTNPQNGIVRRAMAAIRQWLRSNIPGMENLALSDAEIIETILTPAREFIQNGPSRDSQNGTKRETRGIQFSRSAPSPAKAAIKDRMEKIKDSLIYNFQDRFKPLKDIQNRAGAVTEDEDASLAEERYSGIVRARTDSFEEQLRDPLIKAIHDSGVAYEDVEDYLHALHAPSRNAAMHEINPTEDELQAKKDALTGTRDSLAKDPDVKEYLKLRKELRQAEADIEDGIADESLATMIKREIGNLRKLDTVKDYSDALEKLKALRIVKPFKGDNTALSGMSNAEAKAILDKADKNGTRKALDKISGLVDTITKKTREIYVNSGLEKADAIEAWDKKYEHYVPLHRDEVSGEAMPKTGQGFNIRGRESKRATGSNKEATNILAHVVAQHEAAIIRSEKAAVDRTLFKFAQTHPDPDLWTLDVTPMLRVVDPNSGLVVERVDPIYKNKPEVLTLKIDGEEHTITFNEKNQEGMRLVASLKNMSSEQLGEVTQLVGKVTRFLATMNTTMNPVFTARNFLRDLQTAYVNLSDTAIAAKKAEVFKNLAPAIKGMWNLSRGKANSQWAKYAQEFKSAGGQTGWMEHYKDIGARADTLKKELATMGPGRWNLTKRKARAWLDIIEDANTAVENGVRLSAYVQARKSGLSEGKAAQIAKNLTVNFNARGARGTEINSWYMFLNASIQGTARLVKALSNKQVQKIVSGVVLSGFLMDILARSLAGDGDDDGENDYDQLPEHTKAMNFILMVDGRPVTIPMPYGYNFFASAGRKVSEMMFRPNYSAARSAADLAGVFLDAFSPTGQAGSFLQYIAPTVADPWIQWAENKNFAGNPLRRPQSPFGVPNPEYQMGFKSTSAPAKWLTEILNDGTGGNEVRPGFININPVFFDFTVSSILGGAGRSYLQAVSGPLKAGAGEDLQAREIPFVNIFLGAKPEFQTERKYFEAINKVELTRKELKTYREKGDTEMVRQIREEHGPELALDRFAAKTKKDLERLRKRENIIIKNDAPNKRELKKQIEERRRVIMAEFNKRYAVAVAAE